MKVMTVVGTRPEIIRLSRVMAALDRYMKQIIVHTGQNYDYELNQIFFDDLEIRKPDYFLEAAGATASETVGQVIARVDRVLEKEQPEAMLVLGDTNSCLAAYPAKRRKVPVFHMEAGNRCFDQRVPEEINRRIVDHISDINMPYSVISRAYLLAEGLPADRVIKTGSPMYEVLHYYMPKIEASDVLRRLELQEEDYFVISSHREENIDDPEQFAGLIEVLNGLTERFRKPIIFSTHPRTRKRIESERDQIARGRRRLGGIGRDQPQRDQHPGQQALELGESSLYTALQRLLLNGWVKDEWGASENNRRARYYTLTPAGRKHLAAQTREFDLVVSAIQRVLRTA